MRDLVDRCWVVQDCSFQNHLPSDPGFEWPVGAHGATSRACCLDIECLSKMLAIRNSVVSPVEVYGFAEKLTYVVASQDLQVAAELIVGKY